MEVLVVKKTTNYELYGEEVEKQITDGQLDPSAMDKLQWAHKEHNNTLETLEGLLQKKNIKFKTIDREELLSAHDPQIPIITVGGDGTILSASHFLSSGGTLVGIRSSAASVGYLCYGNSQNIDQTLQELISGKIHTIPVSRLSATVHRAASSQTYHSPPILNDFLFTNKNPAATTRYRINFRGHEETHRSSGIWISTPTGSTAGIYAAGGEKQPITAQNFQFKVRELFTLGNSPASISHGYFETDCIEIENHCRSAILAYDGQHGEQILKYGDLIRFNPALPINLAVKKS